jgi:hypothetical protein
VFRTLVKAPKDSAAFAWIGAYGSLAIATVTFVQANIEDVQRKRIALSGLEFSAQFMRIVRRLELDIAPFLCLPDRFDRFVSAMRFGITAVGCHNGMLRIRSHRNSLKLATVSLGRELALKLLSTPICGFVVVKTATGIQEFTASGLFVTKIDHTKEIREWAAYRSFEGCDGVECDDGDGRLWNGSM